MKSLHQKTTETSWEIYKELELIPNSVPAPRNNKPSSTFGLAKVWQLLVAALTRELVYADQQAEYLERCWASDSVKSDKTQSNSLQKLWQLIK